MVAIAVLAIMVILLEELFNNATTAVTLSTDHSESDEAVGQLFTRMAADFSHMVRRPDVDYYVKSTSPGVTSAGTASPALTMSGNDQMAFYSEVAGYATAADAQNVVSLVAYRVNVQGGAATPLPYLQRMGKALSWTSSDSSLIQPMVFEPQTLAQVWPAATDPSAADPDWEMISPNVFRFEYYYVLRNGTTTAVPWEPALGSTGISGFKDVTAIGVTVALSDRQATTLETLNQLTSLAGSMEDYKEGAKIGSLETDWQTQVTASALSATIKKGIRVYGRLFSLTPAAQ
jgi:hypothetical protein